MGLAQGPSLDSEDVKLHVHHEDEGGGAPLGCLPERGRVCPFLAEGVRPES